MWSTTMTSTGPRVDSRRRRRHGGRDFIRHKAQPDIEGVRKTGLIDDGAAERHRESADQLRHEYPSPLHQRAGGFQRDDDSAAPHERGRPDPGGAILPPNQSGGASGGGVASPLTETATSSQQSSRSARMWPEIL